MADFTKRVEHLFRYIDEDEKLEKKPEILVLANGVSPHVDSSLFYLTGFSYGLFEGSILVAERSGAISLITSPLEEPIARASAPKNLQIYVETEAKAISTRLRKIAGRKTGVIGINSPELSYKSFLQIKSILKHSKFADVSEAFESARLIKDATEIEKIQEACNIASKAYKKIPSMLKDGVSESSVASEMANEMQKLGGSGVSFDSIVAFGENSAQPHYSAGNGKLKNNQFVLCDYGTKISACTAQTLLARLYSAVHRRSKRECMKLLRPRWNWERISAHLKIPEMSFTKK